MALNLYRRHNRTCSGNHPEDSKSSQLEERKKGWVRCDCPITAAGVFPNGKFLRRSTGEWEWDKAEAVRQQWEATTAAPPPLTPDPVPPIPPTPSTGKATKVKIEDAKKAFLEDHKTFGTALGSLRRYGWLMRSFERYSAAHGLAHIDEWTTPEVRLFAASLGHGAVSTQKSISILHGFFAFCWENKWITDNPAAIRRRRNRATANGGKQRLPYTNDEIARMYDACLRYQGRKWNGQDLMDFISIAVFTGLRRCDAAGFHISRLNPETGEVHIRTTKYGTKVCTWVPEWLAERITLRAATIGPYIFGQRMTADPSVIGHTWYVRLQELWKLCGPWKEKPNVHRFRHTFIRILLEEGKTPAFVADLVGDTEATIRRHYSAWVASRQEVVTKALRDSFANVPKPQYASDPDKIIAFERRKKPA